MNLISAVVRNERWFARGQGVPRPPSVTPRSSLREYHNSPRFQGGAPLRLLVAAGPFCTADNLSYQPLDDLMAIVMRCRPDVLLLVGADRMGGAWPRGSVSEWDA